jgi:hypothetical protein
MKIIYYVIVIFYLVQVSCSNKNSKEEVTITVKSMNQPERPISVLRDLVISKGDIGAYEELCIAYMDFEHGDFYEIAKIMADKYDYPAAYYEVYIQILKPTQRAGVTINLDSCSNEERLEAINYLKMAYEKGHKPSGDELEYLKKEGFLE